MTIKLKILKESKGKNSPKQDADVEKIDESMMDLLSDPMTITAGIGGLSMLYKMFFGSEPDLGSPESLRRAREAVNKKVAKADSMTKDYRKQKDLEDKMRKSRYQKQLDQMKKDRGIDVDVDSAGALPLKGDPVPSQEVPIDQEDLERYVKIMNRVSRGEGSMENPALKKLIGKYGKARLDDAAKDMLYEVFKRFM